MTRILVTGADGGIGRATVRHLLDRGYAVTALSTAFEEVAHRRAADAAVGTGDEDARHDLTLRRRQVWSSRSCGPLVEVLLSEWVAPARARSMLATSASVLPTARGARSGRR